MAYYGVLLAYWRGYVYTLDSYWVMGGLLCGLLLRFEFLGGAVERLIRALELFVFVYVACRCIRLILRLATPHRSTGNPDCCQARQPPSSEIAF